MTYHVGEMIRYRMGRMVTRDDIMYGVGLVLETIPDPDGFGEQVRVLAADGSTKNVRVHGSSSLW